MLTAIDNKCLPIPTDNNLNSLIFFCNINLFHSNLELNEILFKWIKHAHFFTDKLKFL